MFRSSELGYTCVRFFLHFLTISRRRKCAGWEEKTSRVRAFNQYIFLFLLLQATNPLFKNAGAVCLLP